MTKKELYSLLKANIDLPIAYHHFDEPPSVPFIAYIEAGTIIYYADNKAYHKEKDYAIELYTDEPRDDLEELLESIFDNHEIAWQSLTPIYIEDEKLYLKTYYI